MRFGIGLLLAAALATTACREEKVPEKLSENGTLISEITVEDARRLCDSEYKFEQDCLGKQVVWRARVEKMTGTTSAILQTNPRVALLANFQSVVTSEQTAAEIQFVGMLQSYENDRILVEQARVLSTSPQQAVAVTHAPPPPPRIEKLSEEALKREAQQSCEWRLRSRYSPSRGENVQGVFNVLTVREGSGAVSTGYVRVEHIIYKHQWWMKFRCTYDPETMSTDLTVTERD